MLRSLWRKLKPSPARESRGIMEPLEDRRMLSASSHIKPAFVIGGGVGTPPTTISDPLTVAYAPHIRVEGKTMSVWSAKYWQWQLSFPVATNPAFDATGAFSSKGDVGRVFILPSFVSLTTQSGTATATRTVTIPRNKPILVALAPIEFDNPDTPPGGFTVDQLRAQAATVAGGYTNLGLTIDGQSLASSDLFSRREISPTFSYTLPSKDNVLQKFGLNVKGRVSPAVADGFFVMLQPLSPGTHTIEFSNTTQATANSGAGSGDIVYLITVPTKH